MIKLLSSLLCVALSVNAEVIIDEGLLITAKSTGTTVYVSCIVTPPVTAAQEAACTALYATYKTALTALNAPLPLVIALDPDPYVWSPYDICRYETGHIVFGDQIIVPFCPTV